MVAKASETRAAAAKDRRLRSLTLSRILRATEGSSTGRRPVPSTSQSPVWATFHKPVRADSR